MAGPGRTLHDILQNFSFLSLFFGCSLGRLAAHIYGNRVGICLSSAGSLARFELAILDCRKSCSAVLESSGLPSHDRGMVSIRPATIDDLPGMQACALEA